MPKERFPMGEDHEFDQSPVNIEWKGPVGGENPHPDIWQGPISAKPEIVAKRFGSSESEVPAIMNRLKELAANRFRLADVLSSVRCIDGRSESQRPAREPLGPQVPGGTPVMALCYRLANWKPGATIESDLEEYRQLIEGLPFPPGAHEDETNAASEEKTGCGAIDKMIGILELMCDRQAMFAYARAIVEPEVSDDALADAVEEVIANAEMILTELRDSYLPKGHGKESSGKRLLKKVKSIGHKQNIHTVEKLAGEHREVLLTVNKIQGTTFDRDGFAEDTEGLAQSFNYDYWHAVDRARTVYASDEGAQRRMIVANVMYAVGTAMALTDGSLELGIRG